MTGMDNKETGISVIQWEAVECRKNARESFENVTEPFFTLKCLKGYYCSVPLL